MRNIKSEIAEILAEKMAPFSAIKVAYEDMDLCGKSKKEWQAKWTDLYTAAHPE